MNYDNKSIIVSNILNKAAVKCFVSSETDIIKILDDAKKECKQRINDEKYQIEIDRRVAEWKLRLFCDKNLSIDKVNKLFDGCLKLGFSNKNIKIDTYLYFTLYCVNNNYYDIAIVNINKIKSYLPWKSKHEIEYSKSKMETINRLMLSMEVK